MFYMIFWWLKFLGKFARHARRRVQIGSENLRHVFNSDAAKVEEIPGFGIKPAINSNEGVEIGT